VSEKRKRYTKKDYSDALNKLLGVNIDWTKLSYDDLVTLTVLFSNPDILMKRLGVKAASIDEQRLKLLKRLGRRGVKGLRKLGFEGPVVELLEELLGE